VGRTLRRARALSRWLAGGLALWGWLGVAAAAHEVSPSNLFFTVDGGEIRFTLRAGLEGFLAGIDLSETANTNDAAEAAAYDALRALPPEEIAARWEAFWPEFAAGITITVGGEVLTPVLTGIEVPAMGDTELLRVSVLTFEVPRRGDTLSFAWDRTYGQVTVLQEGVEMPYGGLLMEGRATPEIALGAGGGLRGRLWPEGLYLAGLLVLLGLVATVARRRG